MSSCAASCCICSRKVSCASGTSAFWPIADVPQRCHFAFSCSARQHKPRQRYPPQVRAMLGFAPNVAGRCLSSKGLQLRSSSSVLHRPGMPSPHETSIDISNLLRASARYLSLCLPVRPIPLLHSPRSSLPHHISPCSNSSSLSILGCPPSRIPDVSSNPLFPLLNFHNTRVRRKTERLPSSRCIERAPEPPCSPHHSSVNARVRYSTKTYQAQLFLEAAREITSGLPVTRSVS